VGQFYGDIFLTQQKRLGGAQYLDFIISEINGLRTTGLEETKALGKKGHR
jgi:hypothetical protein